MLSLVVAAALVALGGAVKVIGPSGELRIVNRDLAPDGTSRSTVVAGGTFPGPVIRGVKGDNFKINVNNLLHDGNQMNQTTSIHWHGLFQHGTNYADGPAFVNQCPIARGHSFLYDFDVPDQAGTFWYHSHMSVQYCDGLRGAFIVYDGIDGQNDPHRDLYDVDDESTIITLADWYQLPSLQVLSVPGPKVANTTLINGKGRFGGDPSADLAVIHVTKGKRYRFRIIGMSCDSAYTFSVDGHNLTLIEVDGEYLQPTTIQAVQVCAGQRYSVILEANQPVRNYWIRAGPNSATQYTGFDNGINSAILRYRGAKKVEPRTQMPPDLRPVRESDLHPLESFIPDPTNPEAVDHVLDLTLGFDAPNEIFSINEVPWSSPALPVLLQVLSGAQKAQDLMPAGTIYDLPLNKTIQINFHGGNAPGDPHPFHLHGHSFDVIKSADSDIYNWIDPVRRDVTSITQGNLTVIRFVTDNPGPWFLHCHIDWHLDRGLAVVLAEASDEVNNVTNPVPDAWRELCPIYASLTEDEL